MTLRKAAGRTGVVSAIGAAVLALTPAVSLAHESRTIGNGAYQVEVGWETEPALEGAQNALTLEIARVGTASESGRLHFYPDRRE